MNLKRGHHLQHCSVITQCCFDHSLEGVQTIFHRVKHHRGLGFKHLISHFKATHDILINNTSTSGYRPLRKRKRDEAKL